MNHLFLRLAASYGQTWRSLYKTDSFLQFTKKEWAKRLSPFDDATLDAAFEQCLDTCLYPPTLPQFIDSCKSIQKRHNFFMRPHVAEDVASHKTAQIHLKKIRTSLNMATSGRTK